MLVLVGCDMVIWIQWLQELGTVLWDFQKLTTNFSISGKTLQLQGLATTKLIEEGSLTTFNKLKKRRTLLHVLEDYKRGSYEESYEAPAAIQALLKQYNEVF